MSAAYQKALIYCRVSDVKQTTDGSGLQSQEYRCRQYAAERHYVVEQIFQDDVSGGGDFAKRPGMSALVHYIETQKHTNYVIIFDDLKRFARDTLFHLQLRKVISECNAQVECLNYTFDDSPEGRFMETIFAAQGELERKQIGRQTLQKTKARLEAGYHAFIAPVGYRYEKSKTQGKILTKDEPAASIITEMMLGFASGRFQTKQEAKCFLESVAEFPKAASGKIGNSQVDKILSNPLYAGYIEYKPWGVSLRKGQHEGLVDYEMFCMIQDRLAGRSHAPARKDLNQDFPLRGAVACECGNALTAAWSKSRSGKLHPYYVCQNRKCDYKGKSIRRDVLEDEFEDLLNKLAPSKPLIVTADKMFRKLWEHRATSQATSKAHLESQIGKLDKDIEQLLDRIVEAQSPTVMKAFEQRIEKLEKEKLLLAEKISQTGQSVRPFDEMYRTAMTFLKNPKKIWHLGGLAEKRAVLKLAFTDRLVWDRKGAYRTPQLSLPFKLLGDFFMHEIKMVPRGGIEPPTRGFSIPCSTPELPGLTGKLVP